MKYTSKYSAAMPARWLLLALLAVIVGEAVFFIWFSAPERSDVYLKTKLIASDIWQEPIAPIPVFLNSDMPKVALGRRLFHEPLFSRDGKTSCARCHNLATGGQDGLKHAASLDGKRGKINTLAILNSGANFRLFWDGRAATLEEVIEFPVPHAPEMDVSWTEVIARLEKDEAYRRDFFTIYQKGIAPDLIKDAIATFIRSLTTPNSKFDRFLRGDLHALDSDEMAGYELFKSLGCISCHQGQNVGGNMYEKLGLIENYFENRGNVQKVDFGRYNVTGDEDDRFEFRVPSLRNVALTAPYFHDASASTLEHAVATMAKYQLGVDLSAEEVAKIVKFLNALTGEYQDRPEK